MKTILIIALAIFAYTTPALAQQNTLPNSALMHGTSWDLDIEGGVGFAVNGNIPEEFFGRVRTGLLIVREPLFMGIGPVAEIGGISGWGFGGQVDLVHLWGGYTLHLGGVYAKNEEFVFHVAIGYSLLSVEYQHHFGDNEPATDAIFFKIGMPIGILAFAL